MKRRGIEALYRRPRTTKPRTWPQDLSVSAARRSDHATEPGLDDGYHLPPNGAWLRLLGGCARLVQSAGSGVARLDHHGGGFLRRDVGGGDGEARQAGDLQHRPGLAVHGRRVHRPARTAKMHGETTSSSSGFISVPTTAGPSPRTSIGRYLEWAPTSLEP
jgi:hypothetical protein